MTLLADADHTQRKPKSSWPSSTLTRRHAEAQALLEESLAFTNRAAIPCPAAPSTCTWPMAGHIDRLPAF
ncbi:MAG: hypothetical protein R2854_19505 [Caldilineaceae bacterium]